jgi:polyisoprenyl-teichoic acid--peptidoglycan teichoic acid transferase
MPDGEKPYRVYRGGRVKGKVPSLAKTSRRAKGGKAEPPDRTPPGRYPGPGAAPKRRRRRYGRWFAIALGVFLLWLTAWILASYFAFRDGVKAAEGRLPNGVRAQLKSQNGLLLTHGTTILLLGTDHSNARERAGDRHSDSILLVHTDPDHHRLAFLSIPRDLRVEIPGHGTAKINAAFQIGGPALAVRTVSALTGLEINHVVIVDFARFRDLIDAIGGVTIDVKKPIYSNSFDCPYSAARCRSWKGWRFAKGKQHMDGQRALIYSRIRENRLDPGESDATRAERQQQVLQAIAGKLASVGTFFDLPFIGGDLLRPVATDLTPGDFMQLGWVKWRSSNGKTLHCRLGGDVETIGGQSYVVPNELDRPVIAMVTGDSAPQPPPPGSGVYGPGCVIGDQTLGTR